MFESREERRRVWWEWEGEWKPVFEGCWGEGLWRMFFWFVWEYHRQRNDLVFKALHNPLKSPPIHLFELPQIRGFNSMEKINSCNVRLSSLPLPFSPLSPQTLPSLTLPIPKQSPRITIMNLKVGARKVYRFFYELFWLH